MIVVVLMDERYPDYSVRETDEKRPGRIKHKFSTGSWSILDYIELSEVELLDLRRVIAEYNAWQAKLLKAYSELTVIEERCR